MMVTKMGQERSIGVSQMQIGSYNGARIVGPCQREFERRENRAGTNGHVRPSWLCLGHSACPIAAIIHAEQ
jgi:hypothetical protein